MLKNKKYLPVLLCLLLLVMRSGAQQTGRHWKAIEKKFFQPPASARPWVFWYWMHGAISKEGITADLEAMQQVGIGGAYLMPIKDTVSSIPFQPTARQLSREWWQLVQFAMQEAQRLDVKLAMHVSDGFALAGGPWITPELSMQKLVWTKTYVKAGDKNIQLPKPASTAGYYKDIAVIAYPANFSQPFSDTVLIPAVTTSNGEKANFLSFEGDNKQSIRCDTACRIQYQYPAPFTCRSVKIKTSGNNYQAHRLLVQSGNDGINFTNVIQLEAPRHGWQDTDEDYTFSIPATTATHFRFVYNREGSEPGAEDLDAAKWKQSLKVTGIYLSDEPVINNYEAKNGSVWRIAAPTTKKMVSDQEAVPFNSIIDITDKMDAEGRLEWSWSNGLRLTGSTRQQQSGRNIQIAENWIIVRIGHTSTGHTNATGGAAQGLECDKFNPVAVQWQFDNWFAKAFSATNPQLAKEVLKIFHVDSWECGSQNWSSNFSHEFKKRRGYDIMPWLLTMTGVVVQDAETSEKILYDVRQTIAELVNDVFYKTLQKAAHEKDCRFSAESVAPTMVSDGMLHYQHVDIPMGEFWLNSPTHDKPNDMLDAISGAHVYGKKIIQAEAFTSVRMNWGEHPGNLKITGDRNFAMGINRMALHVFTHNPWMDRKPGMTLDGVGLYFQRDQTWFKQSKAWIEYLTRCQSLLQMGEPVTDIAVFAGEEVPRRSLLPDRLVSTLPGIIGKEKVAKEKQRLANIGMPLRTIPDGVTHSANMADPEDWIDPLNGYAYDSFNPDALLKMKVKNERVIVPGGSSYKILVIPAQHRMMPVKYAMSVTAAKKIAQLIKDGATVLMDTNYNTSYGREAEEMNVNRVMQEIAGSNKQKGKLAAIPYSEPSFDNLGLQKDVEVLNNNNTIAWAHRQYGDADIYFIANQLNENQPVNILFCVKDKAVKMLDPQTGQLKYDFHRYVEGNRTGVEWTLAAQQSVFVVFSGKYNADKPVPFLPPVTDSIALQKTWSVHFDTAYGGPNDLLQETDLKSWTTYNHPAIKYYSGTVKYMNYFTVHEQQKGKRVFIQLDSVYNIATVLVNGKDCGTLWTSPYELEITEALKTGINDLQINVTNTWHNRLIGDQLAAPEKRVTRTTAPFRLKDKPLLPAGLTGAVKLYVR